MKGRKPKPSALKLIEGNPGKRPVNNREPKPRAGVPSAPAHLDAGAVAEWKRITRELESCGLVTLADRAALAAYCMAYSRWAKAESELKSSGLLIKTPSGTVVQNPLIATANKALELMHEYLVEFGMTPSARTRIKVTIPERKRENPAAKFFRPRK